MKKLLTGALFLHLISVSAITVTIEVHQYPNCTYGNGVLFANVSGGVPPYTYSWSSGSNEEFAYLLPEGTYSVTVFDANMDMATDEFTLEAQPLSTIGEFVPGCVNEDLQLGPAYRMLAFATVPPSSDIGPMGVAPITLGNGYSGTLLTLSNGYGYMYVEPPGGVWPATDDEIPFTDAFGCAGSIFFTLPNPPDFPSVQLLSSQGSCTGVSNGSVELYVDESPNEWAARLELLRDGVSLGDLSSAYGGTSTFGTDPQSIIRNNLAPGEYMVLTTMFAQDPWLQEIVDTYFDGASTTCKDTLLFTIPDLGYDCGTLSGEVFMDDNLNCIQNGVEPRLPGVILEIQPGGLFVTTNAFGHFSTQLPFGNYTIAQQSTLVEEHCTGAPIPFEVSAGTPLAMVPVPDTSLVARDVSISLASGPARPGFLMNYAVTASNNTAGSVTGTQVSITFDPLLSFASASLNPTNVAGNIVTWNLGSINSFASRTIQLYLQVPPDVGLLGYDLVATATVSVNQPETDLTNNTTSTITTITGSYDPNDKQAFTASNNTGIYVIDEDDWIDYTIRFQNTGTDTAFLVIITDTLPAELDPASFQTGTASHPYQVDLSGTGILRFAFPNILLPDSNVNEPASNGFVNFRIKPRLPVLPGTLITNIANIYFDFNPPIITEPSVLVAEFSTGVDMHSSGAMLISPNPASDGFHVALSGNRTAQLSLRDLHGRVVRIVSVTDDRIWMDTAGLASGTYIVEASSTSGSNFRSIVHLIDP